MVHTYTQHERLTGCISSIFGLNNSDIDTMNIVKCTFQIKLSVGFHPTTLLQQHQSECFDFWNESNNHLVSMYQFHGNFS